MMFRVCQAGPWRNMLGFSFKVAVTSSLTSTEVRITHPSWDTWSLRIVMGNSHSLTGWETLADYSYQSDFLIYNAGCRFLLVFDDPPVTSGKLLLHNWISLHTQIKMRTFQQSPVLSNNTLPPNIVSEGPALVYSQVY